MPNQICPHCEKEITDEDIRNYQAYLEECDLYDKFCETEEYRSIDKIGSRWRSGGLIMVLLFIFINPLLSFVTTVAWAKSVYIMPVGILVGLIMLGIDFYYSRESRKEKAFEEFKKSKTA